MALDQNHKYFLLVDGEDKGEKLEDWVTYNFRKEFGLFVNNEGRMNDDELHRIGSPRSKKVQTVGVVFAGKLGTGY